MGRLLEQLDGRNLIICPPVLIEYWRDTFSDFRVPADVESLGKLEKLIEKDTEKYKNIFIDEAHRFRNETNQTYEKLKQICWGKRVILVSATPQNNTPIDLLSQIKLFQKGHNSTIPNLKDIERYFNFLQKKLKGIDRQIARRFLEAYLFMKYPDGRKFKGKAEKFFKDESISEKQSTLKLLDEYSHEKSPEHTQKFPDINEVEKAVKFMLETINKKDDVHYKALCDSLNANSN
jgi:replication-associated recombination protein RarA